MKHESEQRLASLLLVLRRTQQNSLTGGSHECQTVARGDLGPEGAASSSQNSWSGSTSGNPESLGDELMWVPLRTTLCNTTIIVELLELWSLVRFLLLLVLHLVLHCLRRQCEQDFERRLYLLCPWMLLQH